MQHRRIHTYQPLIVDQELSLEEGPARHLTQVLRIKPGTEFILFNGDGYDYIATLTQALRRDVMARVVSRIDPIEPETACDIHLAIGISKGERMDFAIQKAVELGVASVSPLITERCMVRLNSERQQKKVSHWQQIIISACEQSHRKRVPVCQEIISLNEWLVADNDSMGILLDHRANRSLHDMARPSRDIRLLIGPEGGLSEAERGEAKTCGFMGIRLGPRVLRTETAPLAAIAAIQTLWGDFN
ncbi:16S rRNA (uracil(1498)-N(3))-methyltransferase [Sedimenticola selenatireducens]|uniref:Ribosomal RNA small subunit methyltransferase E n=1 Tax=Sedimenticola selenatireducens TaxID=191960 RepID=A0A557S096_9GAMM|nr:16S rRNA (uracil(1498)-N(3))-methyltransferase [Sedimenticola selenatireducens]TVO70833.1 16S rRNA (uracil(1498)-N(3))-methyltransferase [Sedimenticola selenatireducens]TVT65753.1 MAG: 16S rRNA (uracil(1498)-N(3))-methyltransferase [Sedimenticola selenatireducens]